MSQWTPTASTTSTTIIRPRRRRVATRVGATRRLRSTINIRTASDWCASGRRSAVSIRCRRRRRRLTSTHPPPAFSFPTMRPIVPDSFPTIQRRFNSSSSSNIYGIGTILKMKHLVTRCPDRRSTVVEDPDSALGTITTDDPRFNQSSSRSVTSSYSIGWPSSIISFASHFLGAFTSNDFGRYRRSAEMKDPSWDDDHLRAVNNASLHRRNQTGGR